MKQAMQSPVTKDISGVLRDTLSSYKPGSTRNLQGHGFKRVCLQLFGPKGHGKSSLINSCLCVVHNLPFTNDAGAGTTAESFATARIEYKLTDTVYIVDNRGLNRLTKDERLELSAQFRNLRSTTPVDWEFELERTVNQLEDRWNNHCTDFIVPVFVHSVDFGSRINIAGTVNRNTEIVPFLRDAFEITGIFPIVVLTKIQAQNIDKAVNTVEELGSQHIFSLDNYTTTNSVRNMETDSKVLSFLHMCLQEADRGIYKKQHLNIQREFIKQAVEQIKAEMKRQKELQKK
ncbi:uncharacterized protein [Dendropsophus ebraccatus]|uniref:uncharacterized protein isoform X2 n=1 Tax=Dendropsophus ebraccatus TaxID=150705 RepID=UPI0038315195